MPKNRTFASSTVDRSDAQLLVASRSDSAAFAEVYDRHVQAIYVWLRRRVVDDSIALDLTAETFAEALASVSRFRDEAQGSAFPWLFGIARNLLSKYHRHASVERSARERLGMPARELLDPALEQVEERDPHLSRAVRETVEALPADQRAALELRVIDELSYDELARRLSITPGAGRKRVMRALRSLRGRLEGVQL